MALESAAESTTPAEPLRMSEVEGSDTAPWAPIRGEAVAAAGSWLAVANGVGNFLVFDIAGRRLLYFRQGTGKGDHRDTVALSPDGRLLAASNQFSIELFDAATGAELRNVGAGRIYGASFSPNGELLAVLGEGGVDVRDVRTGAIVSRIWANCYTVSSMSFSPDGTMIAIAGEDAGIWRVGDGRRVATLNVHHHVSALEFSPVGETLAVEDASGRVMLLDVRSGQYLALQDGRHARSLAFSPDGSQIAACREGRVRVWRTRDGCVVATSGPAMKAWSVSFYRNDSTLLVCGEDGIRFVKLVASLD